MEPEKKEHKIIHHTKRIVRHVRSRSYEDRMHLVRIATTIVGLLVILLWVALLKHQLRIEPKEKQINKEKQQLFIDKVQKVYDKTKQPLEENN